MWGNVLNLNKVKKICKSFNIKLIEDAAEALGSYIKINNQNIRVINKIKSYLFMQIFNHNLYLFIKIYKTKINL